MFACLREPINCMEFCENIALATGCDGGVVKLWDPRQDGCAMRFHEHGDYVSGLRYSPDHGFLYSSSGDGTLNIFDLRTGNLVNGSHSSEDDLLCVEIVGSGSYVCVGSQEGLLHLFRFDNWGLPEDTLPGHSQSVDRILKVSETAICTASNDGLIRCVYFLLWGGAGERGTSAPLWHSHRRTTNSPPPLQSERGR